MVRAAASCRPIGSACTIRDHLEHKAFALPTSRRARALRCRAAVERAAGVEPALPVWKIGVLPLNNAREHLDGTEARSCAGQTHSRGPTAPTCTRTMNDRRPRAGRRVLPCPRSGAIASELRAARRAAHPSRSCERSTAEPLVDPARSVPARRRPPCAHPCPGCGGWRSRPAPSPPRCCSASRPATATASSAASIGALTAPTPKTSLHHFAAPPTQAECATIGLSCYTPQQMQKAYDMGPLYAHGADRQGEEDPDRRLVRLADDPARPRRVQRDLPPAAHAREGHPALRQGPGVRPDEQRHDRLGGGDDARRRARAHHGARRDDRARRDPGVGDGGADRPPRDDARREVRAGPPPRRRDLAELRRGRGDLRAPEGATSSRSGTRSSRRRSST